MAFTINDRTIGIGSKPFIIAEMSGNHNQSLERALEIVDVAAATGVDALKIQTYTADTITIDYDKDEFFIKDQDSLWEGKSLYSLYKEAYTPWEWHKPIQERCEKHGIIFFSTPFDHTSVDFLEELNVPFYKIASFENNDIDLIKKVAQTKKPIIMSTGMATISELEEAVKTAKDHGCPEIILLKCTSAYPASPKDANVSTIKHLSEMFDVPVGLSDHTMGIGVSIAAVTLGACVIEKHFTLDRNDGGVDSAFSLEPAELKALVEETGRAYESIGKVCYKKSEKEIKSSIFRRSLYIAEDIKKGETLTRENLRSIRPGKGISTRYLDKLIGKVVSKSATKGTPMSWDLV
ncbi:MAG: N-acetylneuraminate synthase [Bacteriovoracaceae bacterium]|jgi:N-acetylneuraminate synthase